MDFYLQGKSCFARLARDHLNGECCTFSGFNYCLARFYTLIKHKQGDKFVSHFIADFNEMYQELEQNTPTLNYYVFYHKLSTWIYVIYV